MTQEFEARTIKMYQRFLKPIAEVTQCMVNDKFDESKDEFFKLPDLNTQDSADFINKVNECIDLEDF